MKRHRAISAHALMILVAATVGCAKSDKSGETATQTKDVGQPSTSGAAAQPAQPPELPVVFESTLSAPDTLDALYRADGQYGNRPTIQAGKGLKLAGGHTPAVVWAKPYLGDRYKVQFEVQLSDKGWAGWTLSGSGCGNSRDSGYACQLETARFSLRREGAEVQSVDLPKAIAPDEWVAVEAEVNGGKVAVAVNRVAVALFTDSQPLSGPLHGWFGMFGPFPGAIFRNLKVSSSATETNRDRQLTAPITEKPAANGELLYELKIQPGVLQAEWWESQPKNARVKGNAVELSAPNGTPDVILKKPFSSNVACEVEFEYPTDEAVNFSVMLWYAATAPESIKNTGWLVGLPNGDGTSGIRWQTGTEKSGEGVWARSPILASTPYYAPLSQRKYLARIESHGSELRVFLDGGLLLKTQRPAEVESPTTPAFFGMRQIYGGSKVHAIRIYQIAKG